MAKPTDYYGGRKSFGGKDGLGPDTGVGHEPQCKEDQPLKKNSGDVPDARRTAGNPCFQPSPDHKNDKPISKGGSDTTKSPFSDAARNITDRED